MVEKPSVDPSSHSTHKQMADWLVFLIMAGGLIGTVVLFIVVLGNWNERHPVWTVVLSTLIGFVTVSTITKWAVMTNAKLIGGWTAVFFILGIILVVAV